jgi:4-hydroxy-tetrahydrodipicolinate reductase
MTKIAVLGATGRMGRTLVRLIAEDDQLTLAGAATEPGHEWIGRDAGAADGLPALGVAITDDVSSAVADSDVAIDFTLPAAAAGNVAACIEQGVGLVMGTTGLSEQQQAALAEAGAQIGIVYGRNMSVGVNVLTELAALAGRVLGQDYDIEITESHHRGKVDAPSGTALQLGEAVALERGTTLAESAVYHRHGATGAREPGEIGFASIRAGGIVGEHSVLFGSEEEMIELRHVALDRQVFARGALRAAGWLAGRSPGLYSMRDVLGLTGP